MEKKKKRKRKDISLSLKLNHGYFFFITLPLLLLSIKYNDSFEREVKEMQKNFPPKGHLNLKSKLAAKLMRQNAHNKVAVHIQIELVSF